MYPVAALTYKRQVVLAHLVPGITYRPSVEAATVIDTVDFVELVVESFEGLAVDFAGILAKPAVDPRALLKAPRQLCNPSMPSASSKALPCPDGRAATVQDLLVHFKAARRCVTCRAPLAFPGKWEPRRLGAYAGLAWPREPGFWSRPSGLGLFAWVPRLTMRGCSGGGGLVLVAPYLCGRGGACGPRAGAHGRHGSLEVWASCPLEISRFHLAVWSARSFHHRVGCGVCHWWAPVPHRPVQMVGRHAPPSADELVARRVPKGCLYWRT